MTANAPMVFVATNDLSGITRGRSAPADALPGILHRGLGWVPADLALTSDGTLAPNPFGSVGDLRLLPALATRVDLPATDTAPATTLFLADQVQPDGTPWACCPRTFARQALDDLFEATGLKVVASFEHEFALTDVPPTAPFSFARHRAAEPFGSELVSLLDQIGYEPENWLPEYGDNQFEITLKPTDALAAADRAIVLRDIVRDKAVRHGHRVTFAPLLDPNGTGNGVHIHLSLVDASTGESAMYDPTKQASLSEIAHRFAAGILVHAPAILPFCASTPASYLRLRPHQWSAGGVFLAERNREALVRLCPISTIGGADPAKQMNLEFRAADATSNPWLAIGCLVRAGLEAIKGKYALPTIWPEAMTEAQFDQVDQLPATLAESLTSLDSDEIVRSWFDNDLLETFRSVKLSEVTNSDGLDPAEVCTRYARAY